MEEELIATRTIAWLGFAVGVLFGAVGNRTNFCTMGAISDIMHMGDWTRMRMWLLAIAVAMVGVSLLRATGLVTIEGSLYGGNEVRWLSGLLGGGMFGVGMVLASGCGSKTLIRIGGGNLKSVVVFVVMGLAAFMTMRGIFAVWRVSTIDQVSVTLDAEQYLPTLVGAWSGMDPAALALWLPMAFGAALIAFVLAHREARTFDSLLGGIGIGLAVVAGWYVTGHIGYVPEHPETLETAFVGTAGNRPESLSLVAPSAQLLELFMYWSDASQFLAFGMAAALGIFAGSLAYAVISGGYREEMFPNAADLKRHALGGLLMGVGGVTGLGCTIGQGLTGISTLSVGSFITVAGIVIGAAATLKYEYWKLMRE